MSKNIETTVHVYAKPGVNRQSRYKSSSIQCIWLRKESAKCIVEIHMFADSVNTVIKFIYTMLTILFHVQDIGYIGSKTR